MNLARTELSDSKRDEVEPCPRLQPRIGFTALERLAVTRLLGNEGLAEIAEERCTAYFADAAARLRSLSRAVAIAESQMAQFALALADAVRRGDPTAARLTERASTAATRRFVLLVDQLRIESQGGRRPVVVVGVAGQVVVSAAA